MERSQMALNLEESDETLINLPSLSSPLLKDDLISPTTCKSAEPVMMSRREKYKMCKLKSTPIMNSLLCKNKILKKANQNCLSSNSQLKSRIHQIESEYEFIETLGVGTYGEVKLALDTSDPSKHVAVKIAKGQTSITMLKNESEILKNLNHECFPKFIDYQIDELSNKAYLIIEYFEGKTLDLYLEDNTFTEESALDHLTSLSSAIEYLHSSKIAHRDLKPQNIIVTQDNKVKIIDFNISKHFIIRSKTDDNLKFEQKFFTQICSPLFAAPEILSADCYSESVDIWGLGVVFLSMLCGIKIFNQCELKTHDESSLSQLMRSISSKISDKTVQIALLMLSNNPEKRPNIKELCNLLVE